MTGPSRSLLKWWILLRAVLLVQWFTSIMIVLIQHYNFCTQLETPAQVMGRDLSCGDSSSRKLMRFVFLVAPSRGGRDDMSGKCEVLCWAVPSHVGCLNGKLHWEITLRRIFTPSYRTRTLSPADAFGGTSSLSVWALNTMQKGVYDAYHAFESRLSSMNCIHVDA